MSVATRKITGAGQAFTALVLLLMALNAGRADTLTLAKNGYSEYVIVLPGDASPSERFGAQQLARHLKTMCGAVLPVVTQDVPPPGPAIYVGPNPALATLGISPDLKDLGDEGYIIRTTGQNLIMAGGRLRGSMYAVYGLLQDHLGCRWYSPEAVVIPPRSTVTIRELNDRQVPAFEYRDTFYTDFNRDQEFGVANRNTGPNGKLDAGVGGCVRIYGASHSFYGMFPEDKYYETHPEYFAMQAGKRLRKAGFMCLSNPDVRRIITETIAGWMEKNPGIKIFDASQADGAEGMCDCPECRMLRGPDGNDTDLVINALNPITEELTAKYPDRYLIFIAYNATRRPPVHARPHPRLIAWFCTENHDPAKKLDFNSTFAREVLEWGAKAEKVFIWDYVTNFGHYWAPNPNFYSVINGIKLYRKAGLDGVMALGVYPESGGGGEFNQLRQWVIAQLLWNPDRDAEALIDDFMRGYYGKAAPLVRKYFDRLHRAAAVTPEKADFLDPVASFLSDSLLQQSLALFDRAEQAAENGTIRLRVREARLPLEYTAMLRGFLETRVKNRLVANPWYPEVRQHYENFVQGVEACGRYWIAEVPLEARVLPTYKVKMEKQIAAFKPVEAEIVTLGNKQLTAEFIPSIGGRIFSLKLAGNPAEFLRRRLLTDDEFGQRSGIEEAVGREYTNWTSEGRVEPFEIIAKKSDFLHLRRVLRNGLVWERKYRLDPKAPILNVESEIANPTTAPVSASIVVTPVFSAKTVGGARVWIQPETEWREVEIAAKGRRQSYLEGIDWPGKAWMTGNPKTGLGILNRIHPEQTAGRKYFYCWWDTGEDAIRMEHFVDPAPIPPGGRLHLEQSYELLRDFHKILLRNSQLDSVSLRPGMAGAPEVPCGHSCPPVN